LEYVELIVKSGYEYQCFLTDVDKTRKEELDVKYKYLFEAINSTIEFFNNPFNKNNLNKTL
jgi:hypothetical protein